MVQQLIIGITTEYISRDIAAFNGREGYHRFRPRSTGLVRMSHPIKQSSILERRFVSFPLRSARHVNSQGQDGTSPAI